MAAHALAKIGEPAIPALTEAAKSKKASVRKYATHALGQIGNEVYETLSKLARDEDPAVRYRAILAMQKHKDKRSLTDAIIALKDRHKKVKLEAVKLMGLLEDQRCIDSLVIYGMTDLSQEVSMETAAILIRFGQPAVGPIIEDFEKSPPFVKTRFIYVLGEIARQNKDDQDQKARDFLISIVKTPQKEVVVKQAAVVKLGDLGDEKAIPALEALKKKIHGNPEYEELLQVTVRSLEKLQKKQ
jgi:HEAT repeat protein